MTIQYTKVDVNDPAVQALAKEMNMAPKEVVTIINQQRYRTRYNRIQQQRMKIARRLMKEHPELVKEVAEPTPSVGPRRNLNVGE
jgi:AraC-like DNA-binding protein